MKKISLAFAALTVMSSCVAVRSDQDQIVLQGKVIMPGGSPQQVAFNQNLFVCAYLSGTIAGLKARTSGYQCSHLITDREGNYFVRSDLRAGGDLGGSGGHGEFQITNADLRLFYGDAGAPNVDEEELTIIEPDSIDTAGKAIQVKADIVVGDLRYFVPRRGSTSGGNANGNLNQNINQNTNTIVIQPVGN